VKEIKSQLGAQTFAWTLILMFLLSAIIGTVFATPPENRGPPEGKGPQPPTIPPKYEFTIEIGTEGDDIFLASPPFLTVETYADTCGWYIPPTNPKARSGGWDAHLPSSWPAEPGVCGEYEVNLDGMNPMTIVAQSFNIGRLWISQKVREFDRQPVDFWEIYVGWGVVQVDEDEWDYSNAWGLRIWTDWDFDPDGTYDPIEDKWVVDFSGASWELVDYENMEGGGGIGHVELSGTIVNGFDVAIVKGDLVDDP